MKLGVWYLNRVEYKLLPTCGVVWSPNDNVRFDILFPNPKYSQRLTAMGDTEWWWYLSGVYGGDAWTIRRGPDTPWAAPSTWWTTTTFASPWAWSSSDPGVGTVGTLRDRRRLRSATRLRQRRARHVPAASTVFLRGGLAF